MPIWFDNAYLIFKPLSLTLRISDWHKWKKHPPVNESGNDRSKDVMAAFSKSVNIISGDKFEHVLISVSFNLVYVAVVLLGRRAKKGVEQYLQPNRELCRAEK